LPQERQPLARLSAPQGPGLGLGTRMKRIQQALSRTSTWLECQVSNAFSWNILLFLYEAVASKHFSPARHNRPVEFCAIRQRHGLAFIDNLIITERITIGKDLGLRFLTQVYVV
jgi:hypothetical protein